MNKTLWLIPLFLLTGCPGPGDRMVKKIPAEVTTKENHLCITYAVKPGDRITSLQIGSESGETWYEVFNDKPVLPRSGECLPTWNYPFAKSKTYTLFYGLSNDSQPHKQLIQASFTFAP